MSDPCIEQQSGLEITAVGSECEQFLSVNGPIVFVYSSSPAWSRSVAQVVSTLTPYPSQAVTSQARLVGLLNKATCWPIPPTVVIHLPDDERCIVAECVRWIVRLRCQEPYWMGGLLVITNSPASKDAVQKVDIRSGAQSRTGTLEAMPEAHKVLALPLEVVSVCQAICNLQSPGLFPNAWMQFYESGPLCCAKTLLTEANTLVGENDPIEALRKWTDILEALGSICWGSFHLHGTTAANLQAVLAARPTIETLGRTLQLAQDVLDKVIQTE